MKADLLEQAVSEMSPESDFQFYCAAHDYGWSIDGDGSNSGCPSCQRGDDYWDRVDAAYSEFKEGGF